jgi:MoaA/NifB/PqqE/SkfB family radical SAM enzyme
MYRWKSYCERKSVNRYLAVERIEFLVTYLCSGKCAHCYATKYREGLPKHVDGSMAVDIVRKVSKKYDVNSVMTFGGEPLLFPDITCSIHREATRSGIPSREVITNSYWSNDIRKIRRIARSLAESGVNDVHVSVDAFHQEHIPLEIVKRTVKSCLGMGIEGIVWNPCWVISQDDDNRYNRKTKAILKELEDLPIRVSEGNILEPSGLALINLVEFLPRKKRMPAGKCGDMPYTERLDSKKSISVEPDGKIAVCNNFHIGNASETDIIDILENYDPFEIPEMKAIIENGMRGLVDWAKKKGVKPDPSGYYSVCHMCTDLRKGATP